MWFQAGRSLTQSDVSPLSAVFQILRAANLSHRKYALDSELLQVHCRTYEHLHKGMLAALLFLKESDSD